MIFFNKTSLAVVLLSLYVSTINATISIDSFDVVSVPDGEIFAQNVKNGDVLSYWMVDGSEKLNVVAHTSSDDESDASVRSVVLTRVGRVAVQTENVEPYALCGDIDGVFKRCFGFRPATTHTIEATAYSRLNGNGKVLATSSVTFSFNTASYSFCSGQNELGPSSPDDNGACTCPKGFEHVGDDCLQISCLHNAELVDGQCECVDDTFFEMTDDGRTCKRRCDYKFELPPSNPEASFNQCDCEEGFIFRSDQNDRAGLSDYYNTGNSLCFERCTGHNENSLDFQVCECESGYFRLDDGRCVTNSKPCDEFSDDGDDCVCRNPDQELLFRFFCVNVCDGPNQLPSDRFTMEQNECGCTDEYTWDFDEQTCA